MSKPVLFLDDGGVLNDNSVRARQWQRLVGEFFAPLLGGTPEAWAEANQVTAPSLWQPDSVKALWEEANCNYKAFQQFYALRWLTGMCSHLGIEPPLEAEAIELVRRATRWITCRVRSCFRRLYGPNLVNTLKIGPEFYERIFADAGVDPKSAVVVYDSLQALAWAGEVGAQTILVRPKMSRLGVAGRVIHA